MPCAEFSLQAYEDMLNQSKKDQAEVQNRKHYFPAASMLCTFDGCSCYCTEGCTAVLILPAAPETDHNHAVLPSTFHPVQLQIACTQLVCLSLHLNEDCTEKAV